MRPRGRRHEASTGAAGNHRPGSGHTALGLTGCGHGGRACRYRARHGDGSSLVRLRSTDYRHATDLGHGVEESEGRRRSVSTSLRCSATASPNRSPAQPKTSTSTQSRSDGIALRELFEFAGGQRASSPPVRLRYPNHTQSAGFHGQVDRRRRGRGLGRARRAPCGSSRRIVAFGAPPTKPRLLAVTLRSSALPHLGNTWQSSSRLYLSRVDGLSVAVVANHRSPSLRSTLHGRRGNRVVAPHERGRDTVEPKLGVSSCAEVPRHLPAVFRVAVSRLPTACRELPDVCHHFAPRRGVGALAFLRRRQ